MHPFSRVFLFHLFTPFSSIMLLHIREDPDILNDRKKRSAGPYVRTYASQLLNNFLDYSQTRRLFHMFFDFGLKKVPALAHEFNP